MVVIELQSQTDELKIGLYAMTEKGAAVLNSMVSAIGASRIGFVVTAEDLATASAGRAEIVRTCQELGIPYYERLQRPMQKVDVCFAVAWRWMIQDLEVPLIVFHDSLLPRYRGFAPLVTSLIKGEPTVGVTALLASEEFDRGPILGQEVIEISYPVTIGEVIGLVIPLYQSLALSVIQKLGQIGAGTPQDEEGATYSLWLDDEDYLVDWKQSSSEIRRFVDAVGFPYMGASTVVDDVKFRIFRCVEQPDVTIENRVPGKVMFVEEGCPVVVCGQGLLKILHLSPDGENSNALPLAKFRVRFTGRR
jgi:methionyl-tRNA formyltransferase